MNYKGDERRKYKRVKKPFIVGFQVRPHSPGLDDFSGWDMVATLDLGAGGILFYYDRKLEVGSYLDLRINFSVARPPIKCVGKVIRIEEPHCGYMFLVAVVFTEIDEKDQLALNDVVEKLYHKEFA